MGDQPSTLNNSGALPCNATMSRFTKETAGHCDYPIRVQLFGDQINEDDGYKMGLPTGSRAIEEGGS